MSRVGLRPIDVPKGVEIKIEGRTVSAKGPKGELKLDLTERISAEMKDGQVQVSRTTEDKLARALHGTSRSLVANMIQGVNEGFVKELEIQGVGFKAQAQGQNLVMNVGFSHPVEYEVPEGVTVEVKDGTKIRVTGSDKQAVGQVGAHIRGFCPAEPYKGKGVRYKDEHVRRKAGKTVA